MQNDRRCMTEEKKAALTYKDGLRSANVEICKATLASITGGGRLHITPDEHVRAKQVAAQRFNELSDRAWTKVCSIL